MIKKMKVQLFMDKYRTKLRTGALVLEILAPLGLFLGLSNANSLLSVLSGVLILTGLMFMVVIG